MTRPRIPARPTVYKGIRMRSRLEARFAGILDDIGVDDWKYEGDAFGSGTTQYLPDFTVGAWGISACWYIEVKPYVEDADAIFEQMRVITDSFCEIDPGLGSDCVLAIACPPLGDFLLCELHPAERDRQREGIHFKLGAPRRGLGCFVRGWSHPDDEDYDGPIVLPVPMFGASTFDDLYDPLQVGDAPVHLEWKYR
jgi:hypothetical protein